MTQPTTAITNFGRDFVAAQEEAATNFIGYIKRDGFINEADATKVFNLYLKKKFIKFVYPMRRYDMEAGILDKSFIAAALKIA